MAGSARDLAREIRADVRATVRELRTELQSAARQARHDQRHAPVAKNGVLQRELESLQRAVRAAAARASEEQVDAARAVLADARARVVAALKH